jgi:hypothetical protein
MTAEWDISHGTATAPMTFIASLLGDNSSASSFGRQSASGGDSQVVRGESRCGRVRQHRHSTDSDLRLRPFKSYPGI